MSTHRIPRRRSAGLTLIELLISLTIGLVIVSALSYVYLGSRTAYRTGDNLARMQESGRFALDTIARDIRMAGFTGCRSRSLGGVIWAARPKLAFEGRGDAIRGYGPGDWTMPSTITVTQVGGDTLVLRSAQGGAVEASADNDRDAATVTVSNNIPGFKQKDYVALGTCERLYVIRVTNTPSASRTAAVTLVHAANGPDGDTWGNGNPAGAEHRIDQLTVANAATRPMAFRIDELTYFIGRNPAGRPGLYRYSAASGSTEELIDNVEDMAITYGYDDTGDEVADRYLDPDSVTDWGRVVSVRIGLLVAGPELGAATAPQTYQLRDTNGDGALDTQTAPDTRLRQVFTSTVTLRNRTR